MITIAQDPPRAMIDRVGGGDYRNLLAFAPDFRALGIEPRRVLEIGSGCGRGALLVSQVWPEAEYVGLDVDLLAVEWCQQHVTGAAFHWLPMRNGMYAPGNAERAPRWPVEDGSVDFVFSVSVFTHMQPEGVAHYLRETKRVLAPEGMALHTWFIVDQRIEQGEGIHFVMVSDGFYAADPANPEAIAGYDLPWIWDHCCEELGLGIWTVMRGRWAGPDPMSMDESRVRASEYQDYVVLAK